MTSPGRYRNEPADIVDVINRLDARVSVLENNPRAGNTTIDTGTFRVKDASGDVRVQVGLLSDGTYGIEVLEDGAEAFHQVPYVYTNFVSSPTGDTCSSSTYTDLATPGPHVDVPIRSSGRILVIGTAQIQWISAVAATVTGDGRFDVAFSGANTRSPSESVDPFVGLFQSNVGVSTGTVINFNIISVTTQAVFEGLNSGLTTVTMKYRRSSSATSDPQFFRRSLTVISL